MFDSQKEIHVQLRSADGARTVKVRFPTDEECTERQRRRSDHPPSSSGEDCD